MTVQIFRYIRVFFILILLFSLGLILVDLFPNDYLEPQYSKSINQLESEEVYPNYLFSTDAAIMDNFTDMIMIKACRISDAYTNSIQAAFGNNGYPRYWNGYLLFLRPTLSQFTYQQIRYINMFVLILCFCVCFSGIHRKINIAAAIGFAISIIACFFVFIGESLQYFSVFILLFLVLIMILYNPKFQVLENSALLLFAAGMMTNFFDMLTAPLLTLGIPLILILCLSAKNSESVSMSKQFSSIFTHSIAWCFGYAFCWIAKWTLGTLVLNENIFADALKTGQLRTFGSESFPIDRLLMYKLNIETYYFSKGHKPFVFIIAAITILIIFLFKYHIKNNIKKIIIPVLFIGIYPYIWFFVFANHSQQHYFYTYRIQAITLFAVFAALSSSIDFDRFLSEIIDNKKNQDVFLKSDNC